MDESRAFPRFVPRPGKRVGVTFGETDVVERRIRALKEERLGDVELRVAITRVVQEELERLGARVSGEVREGVRVGK